MVDEEPAVGVWDRLAYVALWLCALTSGFSLPLGRGFLTLGLLFWLVERLRQKNRPFLPATAWLWILFSAVAIVSTVFGVAPARGLPKLSKLLWFGGILLAAHLPVHAPRRLALLQAYAIGTAVPALRAVLTHPWSAWAAARSGAAPNFYTALVDMGSMTNAQRFMLGWIVSLGGWMGLQSGKLRWRWAPLVGIHTLGLLLMFKRGAWVCAASLATILLALRGGRRAWMIYLAAGVIVATLPPVQRRFEGLRAECTTDRGGRLTMWTRVAPALLRRHPWLGVGYRSLSNEMMREVAPEVERKRTHLHSNMAEVLVETGLIGFTVYAVWMGWAVADAVRAVRREGPRATTPGAAAALLTLLMLLGLLGNGLVEYNFADSELVLVYGLLIGLAAAGWRNVSCRAAGAC